MTIENSFGKIILKYRSEKKISQETLATLSGLDRTYISLLERGKRNPTLKTIFKLAKALEVLPSVLVRELEEEEYE
jgi:transcriptional regulator with XRE-family HTH domain